MSTIKLKWNKEEFSIEVEEGCTVEIFKTQVWTLTNVPTDRQKFLGFPGGMLKDTDDFMAKVAKLKAGAKVTLVGTAEGGELKAPQEKVIFEEDLTADERAKILKLRKVELLPAGIKNLGNTCYMNATLHCLSGVKELRTTLDTYELPEAADRNIDSVLTAQFRQLCQQMSVSTDSVVPLQFVMALRQRFPRFGEMQNGGYMQQDADECLRGLLTVLSSTLPGSAAGGNRIDDLFTFKQTSSLKCLECDEEPIQATDESQRVLLCHLGTQTDPVSHIHQGVQLSLKEHIEKTSPFLGRNAQYEKTSYLATLPNYLVVQFARFGYKGASEWTGTAASKVKLTRKCAFQPRFDLYDCATPELKTKLTVGRVKKSEMDDIALEKERQKAVKASLATGDEAKDEEMEPAEDVEMKPVVGEEMDTGYYELISIVSHKGRTADGGHYVAWALNKKMDGKEIKDDLWICFDDEDVSCHNWKDISGINIDLQGGRVDTQIAYINIYKKITVVVPEGGAGERLGTQAEADAAKADATSAPMAEDGGSAPAAP